MDVECVSGKKRSIPIKLIPPVPDAIDPTTATTLQPQHFRKDLLVTDETESEDEDEQSYVESYDTETSSGWTSEEELEVNKQSKKSNKKVLPKENFTAIRSKNEAAPEHESLPDPTPDVLDHDEIVGFGTVLSNLWGLVVIQGYRFYNTGNGYEDDNADEIRATMPDNFVRDPMDEGTVVCLEDKTPLGRIDEVMGPVSQPCYILRCRPLMQLKFAEARKKGKKTKEKKTKEKKTKEKTKGNTNPSSNTNTNTNTSTNTNTNTSANTSTNTNTNPNTSTNTSTNTNTTTKTNTNTSTSNTNPNPSTSTNTSASTSTNGKQAAGLDPQILETARDITEKLSYGVCHVYAVKKTMKFVLKEACMVKGSDASNIHDEPGENEDFSDDEKEREARRRRREAKKMRTQHTAAGAKKVMTRGGAKANKKRRRGGQTRHHQQHNFDQSSYSRPMDVSGHHTAAYGAAPSYQQHYPGVYPGAQHGHSAPGVYPGAQHGHSAPGVYSGAQHGHSAPGAYPGAQHGHSAINHDPYGYDTPRGGHMAAFEPPFPYYPDPGVPTYRPPQYAPYQPPAYGGDPPRGGAFHQAPPAAPSSASRPRPAGNRRVWEPLSPDELRSHAYY